MPDGTGPRPDRTEPYRDGLTRSVPFELRAGDGVGDGRTIDGYGAVFNSPTHIASWEGEFDEVIAPGAFRKSLREGTPRMQFDHGHHPLLGSLPIGRWDMVEEDERGLHVVGRLSDNWLVEPFRDAMRDGAVDGMSFRFSVVREDWTDKDGRKIPATELADMLWYGSGDRGPLLRTLKEVRVSEVGPVTWPAYQDTSVGVRDTSTVIDLGRLDLRTPHARGELARAVALADRLAGERNGAANETFRRLAAHVDRFDEALREHPETSDATEASDAVTEPRSTAVPAVDEHPATAAPPVTAEPAAGEHSSTWERRARMRAESLRVLAAMSKITK
jgi:HK97 family phage prohead protease